MATSSDGRRGEESKAGVLDVSFHRLADHNGESSSAASSRSARKSAEDSGRRSREDAGRWSQDTPGSRSSWHRSERRGHRPRSSGGFLLDSGLFNGSPPGSDLPHRNGKRKMQPNGQLNVDRRRGRPSRLSADGSAGGSPLSRQVSNSQDQPAPSQPPRPARPASLDAAQLVQMALELSESRRRTVSGPSHMPASPRAIRRSSALGRPTTPRSPRNRIADASLRAVSTPYDTGEQQTALAEVTALDFVPDNFTPATLSRAERARKYFELASEHRRLLQNLPPLKPDADAAGNQIYASASSPGSAYHEVVRSPSYQNNKQALGRPYNPLQALRNRRLRARERQSLPAPPETWQDIERIKHWIDNVEAATSSSDYRPGPDRVRLPHYFGDDGGVSDNRDSARGHRRTDTASSVITRPENGWSIEPSELLADTYWTEKNDNKAIIETRHGSPVFRNFARASLDKPRPSAEPSRQPTERRQAHDEDGDVPFHKRAHRATQFLPRTRRVLPRAHSSSSLSEQGSKNNIFRRMDSGGTEMHNSLEGTGALEKHMNDLIAKDEKGELSEGEEKSPDHWDSKNNQFAADRQYSGQSHRSKFSEVDGRLSVDTARAHRRSQSADGRVAGGVGRPTIDRSRTDECPPLPAGFRSSLEVPPSDLAFSASDDERSGHKKEKSRRKLPLFRSRSKERNGTDRTDFAAANGEPPSSLDGTQSVGGRGSVESRRPGRVQRHATDDSIDSLKRQDTATSKASGSAVGRFFKTGRVGDLVRNESGKLFRGKGSESAILAEHEEETDHTADESMTDDEISPRSSIEQQRKPKYNTKNLPTFKSSAPRSANGIPSTDAADHISRQARAQREQGRPNRFGNLPKINLPTGDENGPPDRPSNHNPDKDDRRKSYGMLGYDSGNSSRLSLGSKSGAGGFQKDARRHWSISDRLDMPPQIGKVTMRDVARVRALLLSSGIKAQEIHRRANSPRDKPLPLMERVGETISNPDFLANIPAIEEYTVASRHLSSHIDSTLESFDRTISAFQSGPAKSLTSRIDDLGRKLADHLTTTVHEASDEADSFIVELTTKAPQDVKRVDDSIDVILRERRRQFRLLRRVGFKLLEWVVLGVMWWVWLVVVVFNGARRVAGVGWAVVRWLLWL